METKGMKTREQKNREQPIVACASDSNEPFSTKRNYNQGHNNEKELRQNNQITAAGWENPDR